MVVFQRHCADAKTPGGSSAEGAAAGRASACSSTGRRADGIASNLERPREDIFACAKYGSIPRGGAKGRDLQVAGCDGVLDLVGSSMGILTSDDTPVKSS